MQGGWQGAFQHLAIVTLSPTLRMPNAHLSMVGTVDRQSEHAQPAFPDCVKHVAKGERQHLSCYGPTTHFVHDVLHNGQHMDGLLTNQPFWIVAKLSCAGCGWMGCTCLSHCGMPLAFFAWYAVLCTNPNILSQAFWIAVVA